MLTLSHTSQNTLNKTKFQLESRVSHSYVSNVRRPTTTSKIGPWPTHYSVYTRQCHLFRLWRGNECIHFMYHSNIRTYALYASMCFLLCFRLCFEFIYTLYYLYIYIISCTARSLLLPGTEWTVYLPIHLTVNLTVKWTYRVMVHIYWASHAQNQWSHARLQSSICSPYCDSFWHKLSQYGKKLLYTYVYHVVYYPALHEIINFVHEMLNVCAP